MKAIFDKRRQAFQTRLAKYLPYVFNDHFVLVLLVGLGAVLYQYRELLAHFPSNPIWVYLGLVAIQVLVLGLGQVATYVKPADRHYLLAKEGDLVALVKAATLRAQLVWSLAQALSLAAGFPLLIKAGWASWQLVLLMVVVLLVRWLVMARRGQVFLAAGGLDWPVLLAKEGRRQQGILRFFALFTRVKGLTSTSHHRPYLNWLLALVPKERGWLYHNLYWRAFLRSGDYLALTLRLLFLGILAQFGLSQPLLASGLALVVTFLAVFQLLGLARHYDHRLFLTIAPQGASKKRAGLLWVLRKVLVLAWLIQVPFSQSWSAALLLTLGILSLGVGYLPWKLGRVVDEVGENK